MVTERTERVIELEDRQIRAFFGISRMTVRGMGEDRLIIPGHEAVTTLERLLAFAREHGPAAEKS